MWKHYLLSSGFLAWVVLGLLGAWLAFLYLTGSLCLTCINRGRLPIYDRSTGELKAYMKCPSCGGEWEEQGESYTSFVKGVIKDLWGGCVGWANSFYRKSLRRSERA